MDILDEVDFHGKKWYKPFAMNINQIISRKNIVFGCSLFCIFFVLYFLYQFLNDGVPEFFPLHDIEGIYTIIPPTDTQNDLNLSDYSLENIPELEKFNESLYSIRYRGNNVFMENSDSTHSATILIGYCPENLFDYAWKNVEIEGFFADYTSSRKNNVWNRLFGKLEQCMAGICQTIKNKSIVLNILSIHTIE